MFAGVGERAEAAPVKTNKPPCWNEINIVHIPGIGPNLRWLGELLKHVSKSLKLYLFLLYYIYNKMEWGLSTLFENVIIGRK